MVHILVVEDDEKLNSIICSSLRDAGYDPVGHSNANTALEAMIDNTIDLIISDIMMPGIDGFKFASMIRERRSFTAFSKSDLLRCLNKLANTVVCLAISCISL
jgi:DNA-binding response OmpR family regulator